MKKLIMLLVFLGSVGISNAQFTVFFSYLGAQGPLTDQCVGGNPLPDGTVVEIFWDGNGNGPDSTDLPPCELSPIPEPNYCSFGMNGESAGGIGAGAFFTDPGWGFSVPPPQPWRYWLRICVPGQERYWRTETLIISGGANEFNLTLITDPADTATVDNAIFCTDAPCWIPHPTMDWTPAALPFVTSTNNKSLAADEDGTVHLLTHNGNQVLYYSKGINQPWSDGELINDPDSSGTIADQAIAIKLGSSDLLVTWEENGRVWFGAADSGMYGIVSPPGESAHTPDIAGNSSGALYVVWVADQGQSYALRCAWWNELEWIVGTIPTNIGSFGLGASPRTAVDEEGAAHVVFRGGDFGGYYAKHATNGELGGTNWVVTQLQVPEAESYPGDVAVYSDGTVHAVSSGSNGWGMPGGVYRHERHPEGDWTFGMPISHIGLDTLSGAAPTIAHDTYGTAYSMWLEMSGNLYTGNTYLTHHWLASAELIYADAQTEPAFAIDGLNYGHMVVRGSGNQYSYFRSDRSLNAPELTITPLNIDFDTVEVGQDSTVQLRLQNTGNHTLRFPELFPPAVMVIGEGFSGTEWINVELLPGEIHTSVVGFAPSAAQAYQGYAIITSDAPSSPDTVFLSGRGYIIDDATTTPVAHDFGLNTLYPNPFNGEIGIGYSLAKDSRARLVVYDVLGREVARVLDDNASAGVHHLNWNCSDCAAGVYLFELVAGEMREVKKAVYLK
ncbi:T9SS type A sorting domain-containing protein [bacterium]|nr:T9SS type A sorting domain-containing protein [bacterium]